MNRSPKRFAFGALGLCAAVTFFGGAKIATLLPVTDAGRLAWYGTFTSAAVAAQIDEVTEAELPQRPETPEAGLALVREERALLAEQKKRMAEAEAQMALAREALRVEAGRLSELRDVVRGLLDEAAAKHEADVAHLVDLYGTMKPKEAASLLTQMDLEVVVYVMTEMEPRRGAPILAAMPSGMAQAISRVVLERGKLPGDQQAVRVDLR